MAEFMGSLFGVMKMLELMVTVVCKSVNALKTSELCIL